ncbi:hypothetical protein [Campylobacter ureolyticus]|uniref:hypothetical protein n=1 Tax=Campylobacter ureolyticus TaxID=827 RepID=UPI00112F7F8A|nr:hypothetical protein [Campylobacter ureolyticus]
MKLLNNDGFKPNSYRPRHSHTGSMLVCVRCEFGITTPQFILSYFKFLNLARLKITLINQA